MLREKLKNITIKDLLKDGKISVRASNCCLNANFDSLLDVIEFYENGHSFLTIRNAGKKTCLELENLCKQYISQIEYLESTNNTFEKIEKDLQKKIELENFIKTDLLNTSNNKLIESKDILSYLSNAKKEILKKKFENHISNYSIRTKNKLKSIGYKNFVSNYLFETNDNLLNIRGIGGGSLEEAIDLKNKMKDDLLSLINLSEEVTSKLNVVRGESEIILNDFVTKFLKENDHLPMFWILEKQLVENNNRNIGILIDTFPIFQNYQSKTLKEIAKKYNLTSERIRQIRNNVFHKTFKIKDETIKYKKNDDLISYIQLLKNKNEWTYVLELIPETHIVNRTSYDIECYLKKEQCHFSVEFVMQIIGYIFRDEFTLYGGFDINNRNKSWKSVFLIRKEFTDIFDFEKIIEEFDNILLNNETEYLLNIEDYIVNSRNWINFNFTKIDEVTSIVRDILLHQFGLYSEDINGLIKIPATKEKNPFDVVYEILQQKGNPMHLDEIFSEFKKILPEHKYTKPEQLRPYLQKHKSISYRNRNSVYTLKEWKHIRTGTIRDAIIEFLLKNESPQTVEDIANYVLQHFPRTNISSIRTSMCNDTLKRFSFYDNNLFGLASKKYSAEYKEIEAKKNKRRTFEQRLIDLEKFIVENKRFPFSVSNNKEEKSLHHWWLRIVTGKQQINANQQKEVERIKNQYIDYEKDENNYKWNLNYNKLKNFLLKNKRAPFPKGDEKFLYSWLQRTKDDFLNDRLSDEQRKKYIALTKLI